MQAARTLLAWLSLLVLAALAVQFLFAGAGAFGAASWDLHAVYGLVLTGGSLVLVVLAGLARGCCSRPSRSSC